MAMNASQFRKMTGFNSINDYTNYLERLSDDLRDSGMVETAHDLHIAACIIYQELALSGSLKELGLIKAAPSGVSSVIGRPARLCSPDAD